VGKREFYVDQGSRQRQKRSWKIADIEAPESKRAPWELLKRFITISGW